MLFVRQNVIGRLHTIANKQAWEGIRTVIEHGTNRVRIWNSKRQNY